MSKINRAHQTYIKPAMALRKRLEYAPCVSKVSSGIIRGGLKTHRWGVKIIDDSGAILLRVRGDGCLQDIRIYGPDREILHDFIIKQVESLGLEILTKGD